MSNNSDRLQQICNDLISEITSEEARQYPSLTLLLVAKVARKRKFPIRLQSIRMNPGEYAAWLHSAASDYIFFEANTARVHQEHAITHELSHMLLGHKTYLVTPESKANAGIVMRTLYRDSQEERDAEELTHLIQQVLIKKFGFQAMVMDVASSPLWSELIQGLGVIDE